MLLFQAWRLCQKLECSGIILRYHLQKLMLCIHLMHPSDDVWWKIKSKHFKILTAKHSFFISRRIIPMDWVNFKLLSRNDIIILNNGKSLFPITFSRIFPSHDCNLIGRYEFEISDFGFVTSITFVFFRSRRKYENLRQTCIIAVTYFTHFLSNAFEHLLPITSFSGASKAFKVESSANLKKDCKVFLTSLSRMAATKLFHLNFWAKILHSLLVEFSTERCLQWKWK